ncbi:hypothetical protein SAY86_029747 [Trapa natans]|uniref:Uncharacterized protein n=1 Tax=Trapa natans TaxID=22666 RepID=A0AAN7MLV2_TRANT|nr:hypothetical protein SAY86_029747 [Trapa natans]
MTRGMLSCFGRGHHSGSSSSSKTSPAGGHESLQAEEAPGAGAVLVELFSSQGCATSPAAELLISRLGRGDFEQALGGGKVVVLTFHVDYWDYMGWKDPYGSSTSTVRQKAYVEALGLDTIFTPQVVVQGRAQCMGNDEDALLAAINGAPRFPAPSFQATFQRPSPESLQVTLTGSLRTKVDSNGVNIMVVLYENGIVTDCPAGANKGRVISNDYVVRKLEKLCSMKDVSAKKTVSGTVSFSLWDSFNAGKSGVAIFIQNSFHQILGVQSFPLPENI